MNTEKMVQHFFKLTVLNRDRHKCVFCENTSELHAHHITDKHSMPNGGDVVENGITLCPVHKERAEGGLAVEGMLPDDLYAKVNSSKFKAKEASRHITR